MLEKELHLKYIIMEMEKLKNKLQLFYIIVLGIIILSGCSSSAIDNTFCKNTLGLNLSMNKEIYEYEEDGVRGKGVLFLEYSFHKKDNKILINKGTYPHYYDLRKDWKLSTWEETPLINKQVYQLISEYNIIDKKFGQYISVVKNLLISRKNLVSYYYKESNNNIYAIEMYLIDTSNDKLYLIYIKV